VDRHPTQSVLHRLSLGDSAKLLSLRNCRGPPAAVVGWCRRKALSLRRRAPPNCWAQPSRRQLLFSVGGFLAAAAASRTFSSTMAWRSHGSDNVSLVDTLARNGLVRTPRVKEAMLAVDRGLFSKSKEEVGVPVHSLSQLPGCQAVSCYYNTLQPHVDA
jgi:hypothetical protein